MADPKANGTEGEPSSSEMDVDPQPVADTGDLKVDETKNGVVSDKGEKATSKDSDSQITLKELEVEEDTVIDNKNNDDRNDGIVVLDEDDGTENENAAFDSASESPSKIPDKPASESKSTPSVKKEKEKNVMEKVTDDEDEVLLINPLFGKTSVNSNTVPVYDIESSSEDEEANGPDFTADVGLENFEGDESSTGNWANLGAQQIGQPCGIDCYQEKGILVNEIERLRKAIFELGERHSVIEDFIEVEYGEKFDKYLKNREHLCKMGFGTKDPDAATDVIDGKRSSKSSELVELLKMIKEQAETSGANDDKSSTGSASKGRSASPGNSKKQHNSPPNNNTNRHQQNSKQHERANPIPNIGKRYDQGRGGAMSYQQNYSMMQPELLSRHPSLLNNQYHQQQQLLMGPPQSAQYQQYYDNTMYQNYGGPSRDFVSVVGRKDLYPQSAYGYGGGGYNNSRKADGGTSSKYSASSAADSEEKQGSRRSRKRKRKLESSESGSGPGPNASTSAFSLAALIPQPLSGKPPLQNVAAKPGPGTNRTDINNLQSKRICPLCFKIISRKYLRDHLIVHQGLQISCPICKEEFFMRRRLKLHLRDDHKLSIEECTSYVEKAILSTESEIGIANLNGMMEKATIPTKEQLLKQEQNNASDTDDVSKSQPVRAAQKKGTGSGGGGRPFVFGSQSHQPNRLRQDNADLYGLVDTPNTLPDIYSNSGVQELLQLPDYSRHFKMRACNPYTDFVSVFTFNRYILLFGC
ncbi:Gastrula zinc finger protein XlCGF67.1 [Orchesella cincta]|uniref:Gastrula zinc finger protein XlCGF67.1 n=1 Tax=Orchesella cincta TaxID=48709 RepID=A0A1D2MVM8_ORCCI|nr:Gastrula zinc finger protein XlCGF67.1 [Orchesella cincta]